MQSVETAHTVTTRDEVRRVLLITLMLNLLVAIGKIAIGLVSGALSVMADGFHSLIDSSANVVSLLANHIAHQPPDDDHPYGHRRFETLAALMIGGLLLVTAWEIGRSAVERLLSATSPPDITALTVGVLLVTLVVNVGVSYYERRAGQRLRSELLIADAKHTQSDIYVTTSVLISVLLIRAGLLWVDAVAALMIVMLIGRAAWQVLSQTGRVLVDTAPYTTDELHAWIQEIPAVDDVVRVRSRGPVDAAHIDVDLRVAPATTTDHTAAIADAVREKLEQHIGDVAEVEVHFVPQQTDEPNYALIARAVADHLGLATHEVRINDATRGKILEMHVEVAPGQSLADAHERVTQLETTLQQRLPEVVDVVTHIEPAQMTSHHVCDEITCEAHLATALAHLNAHYPAYDWHDLHIYHDDAGYAIVTHVALPAHTSVETAHLVAEEAEVLLKNAMPDVQRVTIHTEPPDES